MNKITRQQRDFGLGLVSAEIYETSDPITIIREILRVAEGMAQDPDVERPYRLGLLTKYVDILTRRELDACPLAHPHKPHKVSVNMGESVYCPGRLT